MSAAAQRIHLNVCPSADRACTHAHTHQYCQIMVQQMQITDIFFHSELCLSGLLTYLHLRIRIMFIQHETPATQITLFIILRINFTCIMLLEGWWCVCGGGGAAQEKHACLKKQILSTNIGWFQVNLLMFWCCNFQYCSLYITLFLIKLLLMFVLSCGFWFFPFFFPSLSPALFSYSYHNPKQS